MNAIRIIKPAIDCLSSPPAEVQTPQHRQKRLLAWILLFVILFAISVIVLILVFNPHNDPQINRYALLIGGLVVLFMAAYGVNCAGHYSIAALMLIAGAAITPWASILFDASIYAGDFVPLVYTAFSVFLSSILLPTDFTITLALLQILGVSVFLASCSTADSFNWFSFLAYLILTSVFSIISNSLIQRSMQQLEDQTRQLLLNEDRLKELSNRDYLTGIYNRRYMQETLAREIHRAGRTGHAVGVVMLDIDKFKSINDMLGHATGDLVLQGIGKFLSEQIRKSDIVCRYGGDEFVLILPEVTREITLERAEKLRAGAEILGGLPVAVTLSLGAALLPEDGAGGEQILKAADQALYRAKSDGGNRVAAAENGKPARTE